MASPILAPPTSDLGARGLCVLEDDTDYARLFERELSPFAVTVRHTKLPEQTLEFAEAGCRLFVLDINLGDAEPTGGLTALAELKERFPGVFCIVLSATKAHMTEARRLHCDLYLQKTPQLADDIKRLLGQSVLKLAAEREAPPGITRLFDQVVNLAKELRRDLKERASLEADDKVKRIIHYLHLAISDDAADDNLVLAASSLLNAFRTTAYPEVGNWQAQRLDWISGELERSLRIRRWTFDDAVGLKNRLESNGYTTTPSGFDDLTEVLTELTFDEEDGPNHD